MKKALLTSVKEERQSLLLLLGLICGEIGEYIGGDMMPVNGSIVLGIVVTPAGVFFRENFAVLHFLFHPRPYSYKLIRQLNEELKARGYITIAGRIDRKFFHEKLYGMRNGDAREKKEFFSLPS